MTFFELPSELIAQTGAQPRDSSRLLVTHRGSLALRHQVFRDIEDHLGAGDVLVLNQSRVIPARLFAKKETGGTLEVLVLREHRPREWSAYLKPARRAKGRLCFGPLTADVIDILPDGARLLRFDGDLMPVLKELGELPLPPYIRNTDVGERYQTVYAREDGSVAAPTAGLHFTPQLLDRVRAKGVQTCFLTLHVGAGTFKPIVGPIESHTMHEEVFSIPKETADAIHLAKSEGRRVIAVGTTVVRALESAWDNGVLREGPSVTSIFIRPPYTFQVPDALITNFHLPDSTLIHLVSAFAGEDTLQNAYFAALENRYRFYSLGDAMLIL